MLFSRLGTYYRNIKSNTVLQVPASLGKCTLLLFALPGRLNLSTLKRLLLTPDTKCCSASFLLLTLSMLSQLQGQIFPIFCRFLIKTRCEHEHKTGTMTNGTVSVWFLTSLWNKKVMAIYFFWWGNLNYNSSPAVV